MGRYPVAAIRVEELALTMNQLPPAPAVTVEFSQLRKLMALQMSPTNLASGRGDISVGLLTNLICAFCLAGICVLGWLLSRSRRSAHALHLQYNEEEIVSGLHDDNAMVSNGGTSKSVLYRLNLHDNDTGTSRMVVVKMFQNDNGAVDAEIDGRCQSELNLLEGIRHDNIISLAGCIRRDDYMLLVYDHMENGSLHQWLHPGLSQLAEGLQLDWPTRRVIAIGVAGGLCYMHHGRNHPIVHHNINSTNILLDRDLKAKIAGFGLARVNLAGLDQPVPISELTAANIFGYTAPEYATGEVTEKVDVYSFGVVLLELVTGRVANEAVTDGHLATWARRHCNDLMVENSRGFSDVVDMDIPDRARYLKEMAAVFRLGVDCTVKDPRERPTMHTVRRRLRNRRRFGRLLTCYQL